MSFADTDTSAVKHIVLQISRLGGYREIHIDRRTGVTYERESIIANPAVPKPSCT